MVAEMVPQKELQPRAFSIMPLVWSLGSVVGPSFGGFFAKPAEQYPSVFGNMQLFKTFPYLLPNLLATVFFLISLCSAAFFLKVRWSSSLILRPHSHLRLHLHHLGNPRLKTRQDRLGPPRRPAPHPRLFPQAQEHPAPPHLVLCRRRGHRAPRPLQGPPPQRR